jgi:FixJ family two-component response regulator/anti-sigma regulatory factor (Ser/Thr protein kinase)
MEKNPGKRRSRVLVVDDELIGSKMIALTLAKHGCEAILAESVERAKARLQEAGTETFDVVVTDFNMPEQNGLALVEWLRGTDPSLATIVITGSAEKHIVEEALRGGVSDFLEKPVSMARLLTSVAHAVNLTREKRKRRSDERTIREIGHLQNALIRMHSSMMEDRIQVFYHPRQEVGGDFLSVFPLSPTRFVVLATDVSGHDLTAGFLSSYFLGMMSGMVEMKSSLEEIFSFFNRFLINIWNQRENWNGGSGGEASLAACALAVDLEKRTISMINCGFPSAILLNGEDREASVLAGGGNPLGWFNIDRFHTQELTMGDESEIFLWSDGLEDFAASWGIDPLSLASRFQLEDWAGHQTSAVIQMAPDDILSVRINLSASPALSNQVLPILFQRYTGDQVGLIDDFQQFWKKSLTVALPEFGEDDVLHDILLCSREAVLNALCHGCRNAPDASMSIQINYHHDEVSVSVRVSDGGSGHDFDVAAHERARRDGGPVSKHRGLALIHHMASEVRSERRGATLTMIFKIPATPDVK